jgi:hypothetical protein
MAKKKTEDTVERWDLKAVGMADAQEIQESLETGYEPFSVSTLMKKSEASLISAKDGGYTMETLVWLKRKVTVPVVAEASNNVTQIKPAE